MTANAAPSSWKVLDALNWTVDFFKKAGALSPRLDAELLLAEALSMERIQLYMMYDQPLSPTERAAFRPMVLRRANGEPVQYILGRQGFWSLDLVVRPGVLVPRPDTEVLVEEALVEAKRIIEETGRTALRIADVGTGSGAIALALATDLPDAEVWAGDIHDAPLAVAAENTAAAGLNDRVHVVRADLLHDLRVAAGQQAPPFDLVVSNPPYIRPEDLAGLMREVRDWEPAEALVGANPDADGLGVVRRIVDSACMPGMISDFGALLLEIGDEKQSVLLFELLESKGFESVRGRDDYAGKPRAVVGRWRSQ